MYFHQTTNRSVIHANKPQQEVNASLFLFQIWSLSVLVTTPWTKLCTGDRWGHKEVGGTLQWQAASPLYPIRSSQHPTQTRQRTQNSASPADSILFYSNNSVSLLSVFQVHSFVVQLSLQTRSCCTTKYRIVKVWQVCSTFMSKTDGIRIIIHDFEVLWRRSCPQGHSAVRGWRQERAGEEETFEVKW